MFPLVTSNYWLLAALYLETLERGVGGTLQQTASDARHPGQYLEHESIHGMLGGETEREAADLAEGEDGPPAPAVHHQDAEHVARDLDEDAQEEVGVWVAGEAGRGEPQAVVTHRHAEPLSGRGHGYHLYH